MALAIERDKNEAPVRARLYVDAPLGDAEIELSCDQAHYLTRVMRLGEGDPVLLFNGRDGEWLARIAAVGKNRASVAPTERRRRQEAGSDVTLLFAPVKRQPVDLLVRQATELGVRRLLPVMTQRTVAERVNLERLSAIAIEAAEQCERLDLPEVAVPVKLDAALRDWPQDRPLYLADETGKGAPIVEALTGGADSAGLLCGPEGGFAPAELDHMRHLPFVIPVVLGPRILRAETAAIAALSIWQAVRGDWVRKPPDRPGTSRHRDEQE